MMSLSEKAAQLDALSDGQEVSALRAAIQQAADACEAIGQQAAGIIGDLPAGQAANAAWQEAKNELLNSLTNGAVAAAPAKLAEIASAVRQAGTGL
jgi:hypothetical protein